MRRVVAHPRFATAAACAVALLISGCASGKLAAPQSSPGETPKSGSGLQAIALHDDFPQPSLEHPLLDFGTMWTFEAPPLAYWKQRYAFAPTSQWLDHLRLSALRLSDCSASFVSANGLVLTNHHCARECTAAVSPPDTDFLATGFIAGTLRAERKCPGMWVDQLQSFRDVTSQVQGALQSASSNAGAASRDSIISAITSECEKGTGLHCEVVTYYQGGAFSLYRYRRFSDARLVMTPESRIAFFGGDPDNFVYPRFDLDFTLLRVYENDAPYHPDDFLRWSAHGASEGDVTFVIGDPGSTERLRTVAELEYARDAVYPSILRALDADVAAVRDVSAQSPIRERELQNDLFDFGNDQKALHGYYSGLIDSSLMSRKRAFEADFRHRIARDPALNSRYGSAWDSIALAEKERATTESIRRYYHNFPGERLLPLAYQIVRVTKQATLVDSLRLPEYRGTLLDSEMARIRKAPQVDTAVDRRILASLLRNAQRDLPSTDPVLLAALRDQNAESAAARLVATTEIGSPGARAKLLDGGAAAVASSTDPLIALGRIAESRLGSYRKRLDVLDETIAENDARIGAAVYAAYGRTLPPDATFTLRISDGTVKGYSYNGTVAPWKTTFFGLFDRAASFDQKRPFDLPARWLERSGRLDMRTPFDMVSTNDIIGGNSGSPVVNRDGEIVGLIFDGNIEMLPNNFLYRDATGRSVSLTSVGLIEAIRKVYDGNGIADELQGIAHSQ